MMSSDAVKAMISDSCRMINVVRNVFLRFKDSLLRWFWLAIIIKGKSQHDSTTRGLDSESMLNEELKL